MSLAGEVGMNWLDQALNQRCLDARDWVRACLGAGLVGPASCGCRCCVKRVGTTRWPCPRGTSLDAMPIDRSRLCRPNCCATWKPWLRAALVQQRS